MFSTEEVDQFRSRGLIRLRHLLPEQAVTRARELVVRCLERHGCVQRDGVWTFAGLDELPQHESGSKLRKGIKHTGAYRKLVTAELLDAVDSLASGVMPANLKRQCDPGLLLSLPQTEEWTIPHSLWHVDLPRLRNRAVPPGVQMFACLNAVQPKGGGTLVVAGSHRLCDDVAWIGPSVKHAKRLRHLPYFRDLMSEDSTNRSRFMNEPIHIGEVELQVVELHGEPGDVFLVDMRVLHTIAPNASREPRIMVTQRFYREDILDEMYPEH